MFLPMAPCARQSSLKAVPLSPKLAKNRQNMASASALEHPGVAKMLQGRFSGITVMSRKLLCAGAFPGSDFHQVRCLFHANKVV